MLCLLAYTRQGLFRLCDLRQELERFFDCETSYLRKGMILLLHKHNNINDRTSCLMIAKLDVYLHPAIFMRDDLVDCRFH